MNAGSKGKKTKVDQSPSARKVRLAKLNAQLAFKRKAAKKSSRKGSVHTVSGGLPGLNKR